MLPRHKVSSGRLLFYSAIVHLKLAHETLPIHTWHRWQKRVSSWFVLLLNYTIIFVFQYLKKLHDYICYILHINRLRYIYIYIDVYTKHLYVLKCILKVYYTCMQNHFNNTRNIKRFSLCGYHSINDATLGYC